MVDVGTGTGAIALAIKDERPDARVLAIDVSSDAVASARENAARSALVVEVLAGDLLDPLPPELRGAVDLVVGNPPYVEEHELAILSREARADPVLALAGGISIYEDLFAAAADVLRARGAVAVEIGEAQGAAVRAAAARGDYREAFAGIAGLQPSVAKFFDDVLVMAEDQDVRAARLALVAMLRDLILEIADLSEMAAETS